MSKASDLITQNVQLTKSEEIEKKNYLTKLKGFNIFPENYFEELEQKDPFKKNKKYFLDYLMIEINYSNYRKFRENVPLTFADLIDNRFSSYDYVRQKAAEIFRQTITNNDVLKTFSDSAPLNKLLTTYNNLVSKNEQFTMEKLTANHSTIESASASLKKLIDEINKSQTFNDNLKKAKSDLQSKTKSCTIIYPDEDKIPNTVLFGIINNNP